jgi:hypothetical protein
MKSKIIFKMFAGIFIGILASLLLTLHFWGQSFGKVSASIFLGVIIGMFITDTKLSLQILRNTWEHALDFFYECYDNIASVNLNPKKVSKKTWIKRYLILSMGVKYLVSLAISCLPFYLSLMPRVTVKTDCAALLFLISFFALLFSYLFFGVSYSFIGFGMKVSEKVWKDEEIKSKEILDSKKDIIWYKGEIHFDILLKLTLEKGILFVEKKSLLAFFYMNVAMLNGIWIALKKSVLFCGLFLIATVVSISFSIFMIPIWFLRELWKSKKLLVVVLSIIAGGVLGNIYTSYILGIATGFSIAILSLVLEHFFSQARFFLYLERMWSEELWSKTLSI